MTTHISTFVFFCSLKYKVFEINILHVCGTHYWLYADLMGSLHGKQKYSTANKNKTKIQSRRAN
jgi:hypothetical protein